MCTALGRGRPLNTRAADEVAATGPAAGHPSASALLGTTLAPRSHFGLHPAPAAAGHRAKSAGRASKASGLRSGWCEGDAEGAGARRAAEGAAGGGTARHAAAASCAAAPTCPGGCCRGVDRLSATPYDLAKQLVSQAVVQKTLLARNGCGTRGHGQAVQPS